MMSLLNEGEWLNFLTNIEKNGIIRYMVLGYLFWDSSMSVKDKARKFGIEVLTAATLVGGGMSANAGNSNGGNFNPEPQAKVIVDNNNYKTKITVRNDTALMVSGTKAYYDPSADEIYMMKGELSFGDVFENYNEEYVDEGILLTHERQHQINATKGLRSSDVSLDEHYQRCTHDEITAYMAELLELRRRYKEVKTEEDKQAFLKSFCQDDRYAVYLNAIKDGVINPRSESKEDFLKEMAFIKNTAIDKYADDGTAYTATHLDMARAYLAKRGDNVRSNPEAFKKEIKAIYNIGGFDFNTVGKDNLYVVQNSAIKTADNFLAQCVEAKKVDEFIRCCGENFSAFEKLEKMDFSGLSKEQVSQIVQTALVVDDLKGNVAESLIRGEDVAFDFRFVSDDVKIQAAAYLQVKLDLLEKSGELSLEGNTGKFNQLMSGVKQVDIDVDEALNFFDSMNYNLSEEEYKRVEEYRGKTLNFDEVVVNSNEMTLPLDGTSYQEVMD